MEIVYFIKKSYDVSQNGYLKSIVIDVNNDDPSYYISESEFINNFKIRHFSFQTQIKIKSPKYGRNLY